MNEESRVNSRRRLLFCAVGIVCFAAAAYILVPATLELAARSLIRTDPLQKSDVIIALGGDARCMREKRAAELYQEGFAPRVIVSGVPSGWGVNTGDAARRYLVSLGVPEDAILVLRDSWNTRREAIDVDGIMRANNWHSAVIVTSPFHSRRALHTFERYAAGHTFYSSPLPEQPPEWRHARWWSRRGDMGTTVREFIAWCNTLAGGLQ